MTIQAQNKDYSIRLGDQTVPLGADPKGLAARVDLDGDGLITKTELENFVENDHGVSCSCCPRNVKRGEKNPGDVKQLANELSYSLANVPNPDRAGYHSFEAIVKEFDNLESANPNFVQKKVLGKTPEGRDIVAYKFSEGAKGDTSHKTGLVISGCHHAREWMTVEAPLKLAQDLLSGLDKDTAKQARLKDSEIWIVPCVNPDGYEYTRNGDSMWRKNRRPLEVDQLGKPTKEIGVDLNRNYGCKDHFHLWRPEGDTPGATHDDFDATSDHPSSEVYRGPDAASEPEVKAMLNLELNNKNIKGVVDLHSYGNDIFYPWDHTKEESPHANIYKEIAPKIGAATGWTFAQGSELYLNSGDSDETQDAHNIISFCFEIGRSFQPNPSQIPIVTSQTSKGLQVFIDEIIDRDKKGTLPPR